MGSLIHIITFILCINIMLYLGGFSLIEGDILQEFFELNAGDITGITTEFGEAIPDQPTVAGIDTAGDFRMTDIPKTIWKIVLFLLNVMLAPLALFASPELNLPVAFRFMIGVPIALIFIFVIIDWIRGHD